MPTQILTIEEIADYLRLPEDVVINKAAQSNLPGRKIADTWRFLKDVIDDWLRTQDSRAILLNRVGVLADDNNLDETLEKIIKNGVV